MTSLFNKSFGSLSYNTIQRVSPSYQRQPRQPSKTSKKSKHFQPPKPTIYRIKVISDWLPSYTLKYSDEKDFICVSLPHFICSLTKSTTHAQTLDEDLELTLKNYGWSPVAIQSLSKVLFPPGGQWKNFLTINSITGEIF